MSDEQKEILRVHFQNQKADAELMLEMLDRGAPSQQHEEKKQPEKTMTSDELRIRNQFPEPLKQHLTVEQDGRIIRNKFVNREYWMEMNKIAISLGYKWWVDPSNSKNNHWEKQ